MSSESDELGRVGRLGTQPAAASATKPIPVGAPTGRSRPEGVDGGHPVSGTRTRVVSLRAEVELLEAERETLANRALALEADVAELEEKAAALERTVEREERRRRRVIDRYERIVAEREETNRELREAATGGTGLRRVWPAVRSSVKAAWARMKHLVPKG